MGISTSQRIKAIARHLGGQVFCRGWWHEVSGDAQKFKNASRPQAQTRFIQHWKAHRYAFAVYGQGQNDPAADLQRQMATAAAQTGARAAAERGRAGVYEVTAYIQENPASLKTMCFCIGLLLMIFSIVTLINPFAVLFMPRHYLANIYNIMFGVIICICDGKESWMRNCGDVQAKLFQKAFILANPAGRAMFYIYVGTMTMLLVPGDGLWMIIYIILGPMPVRRIRELWDAKEADLKASGAVAIDLDPVP
ncbi:hypothetical protein AK812_SmicGene42568, partial [Symbiodinium microadriaticum]